MQDGAEDFLTYPIGRLKENQDDIVLAWNFEERIRTVSEKLPTTYKKIEILDNLFKNNEILPEIYENLSKEFNKALEDLKHEGQILLGDLDKQIHVQESYVKSLHLARTFIEMEHGIEKIEDQIYHESLTSILKEISNVSYKKLTLTRNKEKVLATLENQQKSEPETGQQSLPDDSAAEPDEKEPVITVRMTQE